MLLLWVIFVVVVAVYDINVKIFPFLSLNGFFVSFDMMGLGFFILGGNEKMSQNLLVLIELD